MARKIGLLDRMEMWITQQRAKQLEREYGESMPNPLPDLRDKLRKAIDAGCREYLDCPKRKNCHKCRAREDCTLANNIERYVRPAVVVKP